MAVCLGLVSSTWPLTATAPPRLSQELQSELALGRLVFSFCSRIFLPHVRHPLANTFLILSYLLPCPPLGFWGTSRHPMSGVACVEIRMLTLAHLYEHFPQLMIFFCLWTAWTVCVYVCVCVCVYQWREGEIKAPAYIFFFFCISQFIRKALVKDTDEQLDERCAGQGLWGRVWRFRDSRGAPPSRCAPVWKLWSSPFRSLMEDFLQYDWLLIFS